MKQSDRERNDEELRLQILRRLEDGLKHEISAGECDALLRGQGYVSNEGVPWNGRRWDFGYAAGLDYVYAVSTVSGGRHFVERTTFLNPREIGASIQIQAADPSIQRQFEVARAKGSLSEWSVRMRRRFFEGGDGHSR